VAVATAGRSAASYTTSGGTTFKVSYSDLNLSVVPISFALDQTHLEPVAKGAPREVAKFLAHIKSEEEKLSSGNSEYFYSVSVNFDIVKKAAEGAVPVRLAAPGEKAEITVSLDENKLPPGFDWSFDSLIKALQKRYSNFKQNKKFHELKRGLEKNRKLCHERYLVPNNTKGTKVKFYNPNIVMEFDKHYERKTSEALILP
jgi:hypothetical protein